MSRLWFLTTLALLGCESAEPIGTTSNAARAPEPPSYTRPGQRGFDQTTQGDSTDRARFCDEAEATRQVVEMVVKPIIPDVSAGGIPLRTKDGEPVLVDDLLGRPEDGKFCDPGGRYADAFTFGPLNEIAVLFDQETRLVNGIQLNSAYRGVLTGQVKRADTTEEVFIRMRDPVRIGGSADSGGRELREYASSAQQAGRSGSWLNHANITLIYGMIRQTFFAAGPLGEGDNCVADRRCDVIYSASDENTPQQTLIAFRDSGVTLVFSPEGQVLGVVVEPVRKAAFELAGVVSLGQGGAMGALFQSALIESCVIDLAGELTWAVVRSRCLSGDAERDISRAQYDVHGQRDAVSVGFDGVTLDFMRADRQASVFQDGEPPADGDRLYSLTYTRSLPAVSVQFVPVALAQDYVVRLGARLARSVAQGAPPEHPFLNFSVPLPQLDGQSLLSARPQRIGALEIPGPTGEPESWVEAVIGFVHESYEVLSPADKALVDPAVLKEAALIEPFVASVLAAFSFGRSDDPKAFTVFQNTDNERWSIGISHFVQNGVPQRLIVQYSLFFGAVTAVTIERGQSPVDELFASINASGEAQALRPSDYYDIRLAAPRFTWNPYRLGGPGIAVGASDRGLDTVQVELADMNGATGKLVVPGTRMEDRAGYLLPLRGERSEFVPSHRVVLAGKETVQVFFVDGEGKIARISQSRFKAAPPLCPGLRLGYGDNVRRAIEAWHELAGDSAYQNCELIFHHSQDGHLLTGVSSLANKIQFSTVAERAVDVSIWR